MLKRLFGFDPQQTTVKTEILVGITTFLTMAYILAVNPDILSATGMDKGALFTSTVLVSALATLVMSMLAKLPFALAPGMGINAFFAYTVCTEMGYSWQFALTAVFIEGIIFIILTITNLREAIVNAIPMTLKHAICAGIGLFIAFVGLQNADIIVSNESTVVSLGTVTSGSGLLTVIGIVITSVFLIYKIKGALLLGILLTALIGIPMGITQFAGIFSTPPSIEPILFQFNFSQIFSGEMLVVIFTFLFVDLFDTIGTLVGVSNKAGMLDEKGEIPHAKKAFMADAIGTTVGAMLGSSTVTTFSESAAGVGAGGRTGLTAFTTAICFLLALFLAPLFLSIPSAATAPVLIVVGLMMITPIKKIDFEDYSESIPAFLCIIFMPLTYSISDGIVFGVVSYVLINLLSKKYKKLTLSMYLLTLLFIVKFLI